MKITGNEPANPVDGVYASDAIRTYNSGMTIRQKIATAMMQSICSNPNSDTSKTDTQRAVLSVRRADALIKALNEISNPNDTGGKL